MKKVTFLATKKAFYQAPIFTQVFFDNDRRTFAIGSDEYEAQEVVENGKTVDHRLGPLILADGKRGSKPPLNILASDTFTLRHNDSYDIADPGDALKVKIFLGTHGVAASRNKVNPNEDRIYLSNPHDEAQAMIDTTKIEREVYKRLLEMSVVDFRDFAFADKKSVLVDSMTEQMLEAYAYAETKSNPQRVLDLLNQREFKAKAFLGRLVQHQLVYNNAGQYRIGTPNGEVLGIDEASAVAFLLTPGNNLIIQNWRTKLLDKNEKMEAKAEEKKEAQKQVNA